MKKKIFFQKTAWRATPDPPVYVGRRHVFVSPDGASSPQNQIPWRSHPGASDVFYQPPLSPTAPPRLGRQLAENGGVLPANVSGHGLIDQLGAGLCHVQSDKSDNFRGTGRSAKTEGVGGWDARLASDRREADQRGQEQLWAILQVIFLEKNSWILRNFTFFIDKNQNIREWSKKLFFWILEIVELYGKIQFFKFFKFFGFFRFFTEFF